MVCLFEFMVEAEDTDNSRSDRLNRVVWLEFQNIDIMKCYEMLFRYCTDSMNADVSKN